MQTTDANYKELFDSGDYIAEAKVVIDGITYEQNKLYNMSVHRKMFKENKPMIGCAVSGEIELSVDDPGRVFSRQAKIVPYYRLRNKTKVSSWIQKGTYYIDTRDIDEETGRIDIHGYDALRLAERVYPSSTLTWSATSPTAFDVMKEIMTFLTGATDVNSNPSRYIEQETIDKINATRHIIGFPAQYTMREVLESIAAIYGGNFIMSDNGKLKLVSFVGAYEETFYLITETGRRITFGGTRILLRG